MAGPIGIFDSGYGGLTVLKKIRELLPQYDFIYLGDNARTPYGSRSFDVVYEFTSQAVQHLFNKGCPLIILACNTASAKALRSIQQNDLEKLNPHGRVLGVIRPSTEVVGNYSKTGHIGVLATEGTVRSNSYPIEIMKFFPELTVVQEACPIWVPLVENNLFDTDAGRAFIFKHLDNILETDPKIDVLILGCTHYPLLKSIIEAHLPPHITVLEQGEIVADKLKDYLNRHPEIERNCSKSGKTEFLTTERADKFDDKASLFLGATVSALHIEL